jgi:hypothetical protein
MKMILSISRSAFCLALGWLLAGSAFVQPPMRPQTPSGPWMDKSLSPDRRADLVVQQMTLDEKLSMLHGKGGFQAEGAVSNGGAGVIQGVPRSAHHFRYDALEQGLCPFLRPDRPGSSGGLRVL